MPTYDTTALNLNRQADAPILQFLTEQHELLRSHVAPEQFGPFVQMLPRLPFSVRDELSTLFAAHPIFSQAVMRHVGNGGFSTDSMLTAGGMLEVAATSTPQKAVDWLRRIFACKSTEIVVISVVSGLTLPGEMEFADGHWLSPPPDMKWSSKAQRMVQDPFDIARMDQPQAWGGVDCFAWKKTTAKVLAESEKRLYEGEIIRKQQQDLLIALALDPAAAPTSSRWWWEDDDPDFRVLSSRSGGHLGQKDDGPEQHIAVQIAGDTRDLVDQFLAIDGTWRNKCAVALGGLHLSRRIMSPSTRAVQLCMALEALLGADLNTEISHRVATRGAVLLADGFEERVKRRRALKSLYDQRSKAVHGMPSDDAKAWTAFSQAAPAILELCRLAVQRGKDFDLDHIDLMGTVEPAAAATGPTSANPSPAPHTT